MRKRAICIIGCILLAMSLTACGKDRLDWKTEIVAYVNDNTDTLRAVCEKWCEEDMVDTADLEATGLSAEVNIFKMSADIIFFEFYAEGLLNASIQGGFYYSPEDEVYNKMGSRGEPVTRENGWEWQEINGGDNYYVTEKICDHFYYYYEGY